MYKENASKGLLVIKNFIKVSEMYLSLLCQSCLSKDISF